MNRLNYKCTFFFQVFLLEETDLKMARLFSDLILLGAGHHQLISMEVLLLCFDYR